MQLLNCKDKDFGGNSTHEFPESAGFRLSNTHFGANIAFSHRFYVNLHIDISVKPMLQTLPFDGIRRLQQRESPKEQTTNNQNL